MNLVNFECAEVMKYNCNTPKELLKKIKNEEIKMVDLRSTDMPGSTHLISIPIK